MAKSAEDTVERAPESRDARITEVLAQTKVAEVGRATLAHKVPPHESFEGSHRWDPSAEWTPQEERAVVWKTDLRLMSWICLMFLGLQLDRGNLSNALTDKFLDDLGLITNDYNNVSIESRTDDQS
jgi:hypothetical protein